MVELIIETVAGAESEKQIYYTEAKQARDLLHGSTISLQKICLELSYGVGINGFRSPVPEFDVAGELEADAYDKRKKLCSDIRDITNGLLPEMVDVFQNMLLNPTIVPNSRQYNIIRELTTEAEIQYVISHGRRVRKFPKSLDPDPDPLFSGFHRLMIYLSDKQLSVEQIKKELEYETMSDDTIVFAVLGIMTAATKICGRAIQPAPFYPKALYEKYLPVVTLSDSILRRIDDYLVNSSNDDTTAGTVSTTIQKPRTFNSEVIV